MSEHNIESAYFQTYHYDASIHDQHFVAVHHGVESVCDGQHRAVCKLSPDGRLNQGVRPEVGGQIITKLN